MREIKFRTWDRLQKKMRIPAMPLLMGGCRWNDGFDTGKDAFELMQFTGLHDKNGKEIWEGDIVHSVMRMPEQEDYVVKWIEETAEFSIQSKNICEKFVEVIGNIYENPELLKEKP